MFLRQTIAVDPCNDKKPIKSLSGQTTELRKVKTGNTYALSNYRQTLNDVRQRHKQTHNHDDLTCLLLLCYKIRSKIQK